MDVIFGIMFASLFPAAVGNSQNILLITWILREEPKGALWSLPSRRGSGEGISAGRPAENPLLVIVIVVFV